MTSPPPLLTLGVRAMNQITFWTTFFVFSFSAGASLTSDMPIGEENLASFQMRQGKGFHPPADSEMKIKARTRDTYSWSEKNQRYELAKTLFTLDLVASSASTQMSRLLSRTSVQDKSTGFVRGLTVYRPDSVVFSSPATKEGVKNEYTAKARMDKKEENLYISFPNEKVDELLMATLQLIKSHLPVQKFKTNIASSDYHCNIQDTNLVCTISYNTKADMKEVLAVVPADTKKQFLDSIKKALL